MHPAAIEAIGLVAGFLTTIAFLPQALKTLRTRRTKDISLVMYVALCTGITAWLVYGLLIHSLSITLANAITLIFAGAVLVMKIRCG